MALSRTFKLLSVLLISVFVIFFVTINKQPEETYYKSAKLGKQNISLELALTAVDHYNGLSDRLPLCETCGLSFIFGDKQTRTFVMRRMLFPLDIIWLVDQTVVGFSQNLTNAEPAIQKNSPQPVNAVIEVPAGFVSRYNINLNDRLIYE